MDIKDLESVLLYFYDNRDRYHYFNDFKQIFKERSLTDLEIQATIQKLVKDGYIIEEEQLQTVRSGSDKSIKDQYKTWGWFISYDGIFLIDTLPVEFKREPYAYLNRIEKKNKRSETIENIPKKYWWLYNPIAFILPLIIGLIIGGQKCKQSDKSNSPKTQVLQHSSKTRQTVNKPLQDIDTQKNNKPLPND